MKYFMKCLHKIPCVLLDWLDKNQKNSLLDLWCPTSNYALYIYIQCLNNFAGYFTS